RVPALIVNLNWYHAVPDHFKLKAQGGPYETPFIHADEVETSWCLALFPELMKQEWVVDNTPFGFLPEGHVDRAGNLLRRPINWYGHVGAGPIEVKAYIEGVVGKPSLAEAQKALPGVEAMLDYLEKLVTDIIKTFPPGVLPPMEYVTEREKEELEPVLKGPAKGGKSIYTLAYPP
ncbi:MAG: 3-dehydro-scyllo-inosose hydrolase, partial [bacterium]